MTPSSTSMIALIALCGACQPSRGGKGEPCGYEGDFFNGSFTCNAGLVCVNFGAVCVPLHSLPAGAACGVMNDACVEGLICVFSNYTWACGDPLGPGEVCGSDDQCASGLACLKECDDSAECLAPDSSNPCGNPQDAADAMVRDGTGEGVGSDDAGSLDGSGPADAQGGADDSAVARVPGAPLPP
jgi:hypothetical protein